MSDFYVGDGIKCYNTTPMRRHRTHRDEIMEIVAYELEGEK